MTRLVAAMSMRLTATRSALLFVLGPHGRDGVLRAGAKLRLDALVALASGRALLVALDLALDIGHDIYLVLRARQFAARAYRC